MDYNDSLQFNRHPDLILLVRPRGVLMEIYRPADDSNGRCNHCERTREKGRASARHLGLKPMYQRFLARPSSSTTIVHRHDLTPLHASTTHPSTHSPIHNGLTQGKTRPRRRPPPSSRYGRVSQALLHTQRFRSHCKCTCYVVLSFA